MHPGHAGAVEFVGIWDLGELLANLEVLAVLVGRNEDLRALLGAHSQLAPALKSAVAVAAADTVDTTALFLDGRDRTYVSLAAWGHERTSARRRRRRRGGRLKRQQRTTTANTQAQVLRSDVCWIEPQLICIRTGRPKPSSNPPFPPIEMSCATDRPSRAMVEQAASTRIFSLCSVCPQRNYSSCQNMAVSNHTPHPPQYSSCTSSRESRIIHSIQENVQTYY